MGKVLLVAGHGTSEDTGAAGNGYKEEDLTREVVRGLAGVFSDFETISSNLSGTSFLRQINPSFDYTPYDYFLEIHFNAANGSANGTEIYIPHEREGIPVDSAILEAVCSALGTKNGGVRHHPIRLSNIERCQGQGVKGALLEVCYIDNSSDVDKYQNNKSGMFTKIAQAIKDTLGLSGSIDASGSSAGYSSQDQTVKHMAEIELSTLEGEVALRPFPNNLQLQLFDTVTLLGLGRFLSGMYYIKGVTTTVSADTNFSESLTVIKREFGDSLKQPDSELKLQWSYETPLQLREENLPMIEVGTTVRICDWEAVWAKDEEGVTVPAWVKNEVLEVAEMDGDLCLVYPINKWIHKSYLCYEYSDPYEIVATWEETSSGSSGGSSSSSIINKAVKWAVDIANDDSHLYSNDVRWGPHYDCSSFVISAYMQAGLSSLKDDGATTTETMVEPFLKNGFKDMKGDSSIDLSKGKGLKKGDVLIRHGGEGGGHAVLVQKSGYLVEAQGHSAGIVADQTYRNSGWANVLRYVMEAEEGEWITGWKCTVYGTPGDGDTGTCGWNGLRYSTVKGCHVAIPTYCIKGSSYYDESKASKFPEFEDGYGTVLEVRNPDNGKTVKAVVADSGGMGPGNQVNHDAVLDLPPNTQKALKIYDTHDIEYRVVGHVDSWKGEQL